MGIPIHILFLISISLLRSEFILFYIFSFFYFFVSVGKVKILIIYIIFSLCAIIKFISRQIKEFKFL